jgi:hypothetical protein
MNTKPSTTATQLLKESCGGVYGQTAECVETKVDSPDHHQQEGGKLTVGKQ